MNSFRKTNVEVAKEKKYSQLKQSPIKPVLAKEEQKKENAPTINPVGSKLLQSVNSLKGEIGKLESSLYDKNKSMSELIQIRFQIEKLYVELMNLEISLMNEDNPYKPKKLTPH